MRPEFLLVAIIAAANCIGCYHQWALRPKEPTPVFESIEFKPRVPAGTGYPIRRVGDEAIELDRGGLLIPAGSLVATLDVGDCVMVIDQRDSKDPDAFKVKLASGSTGWVVYGNGSWERSPSCSH
jgi:hypothetical protein